MHRELFFSTHRLGFQLAVKPESVPEAVATIKNYVEVSIRLRMFCRCSSVRCLRAQPQSFDRVRACLLAGNPMIWYGKQLVARATYLPAIVAAQVAPYALSETPGDLVSSLLGFALTDTLLGALPSAVCSPRASGAKQRHTMRL